MLREEAMSSMGPFGLPELVDGSHDTGEQSQGIGPKYGLVSLNRQPDVALTGVTKELSCQRERTGSSLLLLLDSIEKINVVEIYIIEAKLEIEILVPDTAHTA